MNTAKNKIVTLTDACCTPQGNSFICMLNTTVSNARAIRVWDASVTLSTATNDAVWICCENINKDDQDTIKISPTGNQSNDIRTNILTTVRPINTTTSGLAAFAPVNGPRPVEISTQAIDFVALTFRTPSGATIISTGTAPLITNFWVILEFIF